MKRSFLILILAVLLLVFTSCGKKGPIELPTSESYVNPDLNTPETTPVAITDTFTYVREMNLYTNNEALTGFSRGCEIRTIFYAPFDETPDPEAGPYILSLYLKRAINCSGCTINIYPLTKEWNSSYINWDEYDDDISWDTPGGDWDPSVAVSRTITEDVETLVDIDISPLIDYWQTNDNNGFIVTAQWADTGDMSFISFASQNDSEEDNRPVIGYGDSSLSITSTIHIADLSSIPEYENDPLIFTLGDSMTPVMEIDFSILDPMWTVLEAKLSFAADETLLDDLFDIDITDMENNDTDIYVYSIEDTTASDFRFDDYSISEPEYDSVSGKLVLDITGVFTHAWENGFAMGLVPQSNNYLIRRMELSNPTITVVYRKNIVDYEEE